MELNRIPTGAVVVGHDGSKQADHALDWAWRHGSGETRDLVLLHAVEGGWPAAAEMAGGVDPEPYLHDRDVADLAMLDEARTRIGPVRPGLAVHTVTTRTDARNALLKSSERASLLVVGSRGRGPIASKLLGSVSAAVADRASCPVVVVRPHNPGLVRRGVLVGTDGTPGTLPVLEFAYRHAAASGLALTVVHTVPDRTYIRRSNGHRATPDSVREQGELTLSESLAGLGEKFPDVHVERKVLTGTPTAGLLKLADKMDLVVLGHHHRTPVGRLERGSVAMTVLEHTSSVVALVPVR